MADKIEAGGLEFYTEDRMGGGGADGGPTLRVCARIDGSHVELLRLDMFRIQPHYHYAPGGKNLRYDLDPLTLDDGIGWVIGLLDKKLPEMIAKAGYEQLAESPGTREAMAALPGVERQWRAVVAEHAKATV
jgi:hypothetical protein